MNAITITGDGISLTAELFDTPTARKILEILPFEGAATLWGDEIYFPIPAACRAEPEAREEVEVGELGYWPVGMAFCIFFGPTPVSTNANPRAYSPVNVFGRLLADPAPLRAVQNGALLRVTKTMKPV
ncbi:MAG: cyclophilin-like fold protein [PVC group bacterium]